jgi:hypothetical protein
MTNKAKLTKTMHATVYKDRQLWNVHFGELKRGQANPGKTAHLFRAIGEKLPYEALDAVWKHLAQQNFGVNGVYIAHDSMGFPRYIGRGCIFSRLKARYDAKILELKYFSFYVIADKKHEREIETLLFVRPGPCWSSILVRSGSESCQVTSKTMRLALFSMSVSTNGAL